MSDQEPTFKLDELASLASVSVRTVRYYVQRGLLTAPTFRGRDTVYGPEHLVRLRAIKRLQAARLPLDAIQAELGRRSPEALEALAEGREDVPSALVVNEPSDGGQEAARGSATPGGRWVRWSLAPGLELHLADDAEDEVKALAEQLRELVLRAPGPHEATHRGMRGKSQ